MNSLIHFLSDVASVNQPWLNDQSMWIIGGLIVGLCSMAVYLFSQINNKIDTNGCKIDNINTKVDAFILKNTKEHGEVCSRLDRIEDNQRYFQEKVKEVELDVRKINEHIKYYRDEDAA